MAMNISCKFEKASYNIFFVRAVTVKSLYTLRRQRNEVKSIVSSECYPVDTMRKWTNCHPSTQLMLLNLRDETQALRWTNTKAISYAVKTGRKKRFVQVLPVSNGVTMHCKTATQVCW